MPYRTIHYGLEALKYGETYSASSDRRRMITIDNQMAFVSELIGDGVIKGWGVEIEDLDTFLLSVSSGMGIIGIPVDTNSLTNSYVVRETFGNIQFSLDNNETKYIYMKSLDGEVGGNSGFSDMISISSSNTNPPSPPSNLREIVELRSYDQLSFTWDSWDETTEPDFSHYVVRMVVGEIYDEYIEIGTTTGISYTVEDLEQNTLYTFQVVAVDLSGNESEPSEISLRTTIDSRIPSAPTFVQAMAGNEMVQVIWDHSASEYVTTYRIEIRTLTSTDIVTQRVVDANSQVEFDSTFVEILDLQNNINYEATVYAITQTGYESVGISNRFRPVYALGAGEVIDVGVEFERGIYEQTNLQATISWKYSNSAYNDPYMPDTPIAESFLITFIENGTRVSEPISVRASSYDPSRTYTEIVHFIKYSEGTAVESIRPYTPYLIRIQTEDADKVVSNGIIVRVRRTIPDAPLPAPTDVSVTRQRDDTVNVVWANPPYPYFSHTLITVSIDDLSSSVTDIEVPFDKENIFQSESFVVPSSYFSVNKVYTVTLLPVDEFGEEGAESVTVTSFSDELPSTVIPEPPSGVNLVGKDGEARIYWNHSVSLDVDFYKVYRSIYKTSLRSSSFDIIATLPSNLNSFIDYTAINNTTYVYYVSAVNSYGNESGYPSIRSSIRPSSSGVLIPPSNVSVSKESQFGVSLTWETDDTLFDGYQIYRSVGNIYSFEWLGSAEASELSYIDDDALLETGIIYYYMVRKFKNGSELFVTSSNIPPNGSLFVGKVITSMSNGENVIDIDDSDVMNILHYEDPLRIMTNEAIDVHVHNYEDGVDKRIELRDEAICSEWTTYDFKVYSTDDDIEGADDYVVRVFGTVNEEYFTDASGIKDSISIAQAKEGLCPILYEIDVDGGVITFDSILYTYCEQIEGGAPMDCPVSPYLTEPTLLVQLKGLGEVENILSASRVQSLSATQVNSGELDISQVPSIRHQGRIEEELLPIKSPTRTQDNFVYSLANIYDDDDRKKMGDSICFYDIIRVGDKTGLLAATSSGIFYSGENGSTWEKKESFSIAVYKLFRSSEDKYYAITNYGVYIDTGTAYNEWTEMDGLSNVKVIRDITEDNVGNLYITTDLGIFRLNKDKSYVEDSWEQLSIFGVKSTEAYGILYEVEYYGSSAESNGRILTSNELGLLQSLDNGASWSYVPQFTESVKIINISKVDNYLFLLANKAVYRQDDNISDFIKIGTIDASISRNMVIATDLIYVCTDKGPMVSSQSYTSNSIDFTVVWPNINIKQYQGIVSSLSFIDELLFVGTDRRLFIVDEMDSMWLQYEQFDTVIPTIYKDGVEQKIGFYYNNEGAFHNISFDEKIEYEDIVTISNKYDLYKTSQGGWAQNKYDASFNVYVNDVFFGESPFVTPIDINQFATIQFPTYDTTNSYLPGATLYKGQLDSYINTLTGLVTPTGDDLRELITNIFSSMEKFLSQLYEDARVITVDEIEAPFILPQLKTNLIVKEQGYDAMGQQTIVENDVGCEADITSGVFVFEKWRDRYDSLSVNIYNCTVKNVGDLFHRQIEDYFELVNSGLSSSLSRVQQSNILKTEIFIERQWPDEMGSSSPLFQSRVSIPGTTNWYDDFNSTINYEEICSSSDISFSIIYPTSVFYDRDTSSVFVGGDGGCLVIDVESLDISEVDIGELSSQIVRQIYRNGSFLYILTNKNIYESVDDGDSWSLFDRNGLPLDLYSIVFIKGTMMVGAIDGIYYKASEYMSWEKTFDSEVPIEVMVAPDLLFVVVGTAIYFSGSGYNYTKLDLVEKLNISKMIKFESTFFIASTDGLYSDANTFYGEKPELYEVDIEDGSEEAELLITNDLYADENKMIIGMSEGSYYVLENGELNYKENTGLQAVHKVLIVGDDTWLFGYDMLQISSIEYPIRLSTGVPF
jgi:hypothetical protein